ncbi:MAG: hypothetical protein PHQ22_02410 [Sulfuricurvum sp.]|nr:hypothetical protein [Sulfuricurvum sp.]MDD5386028.1 hypothetical protein [Sulfuricurvum sp.]
MKVLKQIIPTILLSITMLTSLSAADEFIPSNNKNLAVEYTLDNKDIVFDKSFFEFTKKPLESIGFFVSDPHHNVNDVYEKQLGTTSLSQLSFSSLVNDDKARVLFNKDPRISGFTPFNLVIYRKKSDMKTVITHITPEAALDILHISDKDVRDQYIGMFKPLDEAIEKEYGANAKKSYTKIQGYAKHNMMNFEIPFEQPNDIDEFFDAFQEKFETAFQTKGYIIAGFYNMKYSLNTNKDVLPEYSNFVVWSLCHIPFSYTIFDGKNPLPEAAIFAPCSMYAYVKQGENKIVIGMPTLSAWAAALRITDKEKLKKIEELDEEIPSIIRSLGGIDVSNKNPLTH